MPKRSAQHHLVYETVYVFLVILVLWVLAWLAKLQLDTRVPFVSTEFGAFLYWTLAKISLWLAPAWWLIRRSGRTVSSVWNVQQWKRWIFWGAIVGTGIALTGFLPKLFLHHALLPVTFSWATVSVLVIAPLFEEFLLRGAVLENLQRGTSWHVANFITAVLFVSLHLPGWYFLGSLTEKLSSPIGGALSIFVLSLLFGWAQRKGRSTGSAVIAHFLNNLSAL